VQLGQRNVGGGGKFCTKYCWSLGGLKGSSYETVFSSSPPNSGTDKTEFCFRLSSKFSVCHNHRHKKIGESDTFCFVEVKQFRVHTCVLHFKNVHCYTVTIQSYNTIWEIWLLVSSKRYTHYQHFPDIYHKVTLVTKTLVLVIVYCLHTTTAASIKYFQIPSSMALLWFRDWFYTVVLIVVDCSLVFWVGLTLSRLISA
jgi:hypothetical protein